MAYMRAGPNFYVQGGKVVRQNDNYAISPQFYALDISTSWTTDSPPWKALTGGPTYNLQNGVASPDNKTLTTMFQEQTAQLLVNQYSVETNTWKYSFTAVNENLKGIRPVVDPTSGLIYIQGHQNMIVLDTQTMTVQQFAIEKMTMPSRSFPGAVYHPGRKSILYLGGFSPEGYFETRTYITEYMIATNTWSVFVPTGTLPTPRADHCMAINEDGSKILGGRIPFENTTAFIAWGGYDGMNTIDDPPIIYSLSAGNWINTYTAPAYYGNKTQLNSSQESSKLGVILGGTLGSFCVLAFAGVFYLFLKRRADKAQYKALAQRRILSQMDMLDKPSSLSFDNNRSSSSPPLLGSPASTTTSAATAVVVGVSRPTSQYNPIATKPVTRDPQDEGDRNYTIDYDPIKYIQANPHPVVQANLGSVFYVPLVSSHHCPVVSTAAQSPGVGEGRRIREKRKALRTASNAMPTSNSSLLVGQVEGVEQVELQGIEKTTGSEKPREPLRSQELKQQFHKLR
ncbi:hypothetical protein BG015_010688 [Linnemannia schmuckeri]|uniref:Galactose oxidase n=1 Tax=Linnemannia schmuckeri TaxID=64567 RepID=A0A9P5S4Y1_9FUNG|nr:hypothetical protein BG015_010688 [Linnemannia schmuckeri]